jgi:N-hydroxyarylamine O-acetyltransferase
MSLDVAAYLERIGAARPAAPTADALRQLHVKHLDTVPFENLSIALGEPITLDLDALANKIVDRRRGGFCYELNGLFGALLTELGYRVTYVGAQVRNDTWYTFPLDHLALIVACDNGSEWVLDVGFGAHSRHPLRLEFDVEQHDPAGTFVLTWDSDGDVVVSWDGVIQYRYDTHPRALADFEAMCWYQQSAPRSHFTQSVTCSRPTEDGRITLSADKLIRTVDGERHETVLPDDDTILAAYRTHFGIELDRVPRIARA